MIASTALVVLQMAVYLTGYSDCLTSFHEPFSTLNRYHTGLKTAQHNLRHNVAHDEAP